MKKNIVLLYAFIITFVSCEVVDFDLQENPNELTPNSADPNYVLNEVQLLFEGAMYRFVNSTDKIMRYETMNGTYREIADQSALNSTWSTVYQIAQNTKVLDKIVAENSSFKFHGAIANILNAYAMATLVDYLGDIPFSEANDASNFNPKADDDEAIYKTLLNRLDSAISNIEVAQTTPATDMYYQGKKEAWIRLANTLKFKMYLNMGDADKVSQLIIADNLVTDEEFDFEFKYATNNSPDSRHPYYNDASYGSNDFSAYIGNYFMWLLKDSKPVQDPRLRYYLYRQIGINPQDDTSGNFLRCQNQPVFDYCYVGDYYWGRDHGDNNSRPADGYKKTTYGVYPVGGAFDDNQFIPANQTKNMGGAGILPIQLASYVDFLKAEAVLRLGVAGNARMLLENAIKKSLNKVLNFSLLSADAVHKATEAECNAYVNNVLASFDVAASVNEKLDIVLTEFYLASYGNSVESYNAYRRTGYPSSLQIPIRNEDVPFPRTFAMPEDAVNRNSSIDQRPITNQVFWDTNPAGFIK